MTVIEKSHRRKRKFKLPPTLSKEGKYAEKERSRKSMARVRTGAILQAMSDEAERRTEGDYCLYTLNSLLPTQDDTVKINNNNNTNIKLLEWRYIANNKTSFYQLVLGSLEEQDKLTNKPDKEKRKLVPFVFNLSGNIMERISRAMQASKKSETSLCSDELKRAFQAALDRPEGDPVLYWFQLEAASKVNDGKLHLQGSLLITENEEELIREAFHKINGQVKPEFKRRVIWFCQAKRRQIAKKKGQLCADLNWASYNRKESATVQLFYADQHCEKLRQVFTASRGLNKQAECLYNQLREAQRQENIKVS